MRGPFSRAILVAMLLVGVAGFAFHGCARVDDAFISLRYARNLLDGHGLRFNPSDPRPVEGYTNFLWVLVLSAARAVTSDTDLIFGALGTMTLLVLLVLAGRHGGGLEAPLVVCALHGTWFWAYSGLETAALATTLLAFLGAAEAGRPGAAGFLGAVACLIRPDAALAVGLLLLFLLLRDAVAARRMTAVLIAILAPYGIFKWVTFASLLPNTFHAKMGLSTALAFRGLRYLASCLGQPELVLVLGALIVVELRRGICGRGGCATSADGAGVGTGATGFPWLLPALWTAHGVLCLFSGGDYFPHHRFFYPLMPWTVVVLVRRLRRFDHRAPAAFGALMVATFFLSVGGDDVVRGLAEARGVRMLEAFAAKLAPVHPRGTTAVTANSGVLNYRCDWTAVDLYGLTDARLARQAPGRVGAMAGHDRYDLEAVARLEARLVVPGIWLPRADCPVDLRGRPDVVRTAPSVPQALGELLGAEFLGGYRQRTVTAIVDGRPHVFVYYEREP